MQKRVSSAEDQISRITVLKTYLFKIEASQKRKNKIKKNGYAFQVLKGLGGNTKVLD